MIERLLLWTDDRLGTATFLRHALRKAFPDHWSFMLGEINLYCFIVLVATGTFLAFWFVPADTKIVYHGPYQLLRGITMTQAYASILHISLEVNAGLLIRQIHHWAANVFVAGILVHMGRIFFTGAFRNPRELNWIIGVLLLFAVLFEGFTGYSMPDDLLSGLGLRIAVSILTSIPFIGVWAAFFLLGGAFPTDILTPRLYTTHIFIMPALIASGITAHLMILWRQKHAQFPGPRRTEENCIGSPLFPNYTVKSIALGAGTVAVLCMLGAFVQINPVWLWGPYDYKATVPAQPDWYIGWLEGALRIGPPWALHIGGHMVPAAFWPGVLLPIVLLAFLFAVPFADAALRGDCSVHHLLDRPRDVPARTAFGVAFVVFMGGLFFAGSDDVQALYLHIPLNALVWFYRFFCLLGPIAGFAIAYAFAARLREKGGVHEAPRVRLVRRPEGGFDEETLP